MDPRMMMQAGQMGGGQNNMMGGLQQFLGGMFGNSGAPFEAGMDQIQKYFGQAQQQQNPFMQAGQSAIPQYQNWLNQQSNPSQFINNQMGNYQESPWAKNMQQQATRSAQNFGSANGLSGSTPLMMQAQQNAGNISSQDQNNWLQNVLGVNTQYGQGQQKMVGMGQDSANQISQLLQALGISMGQGAYGQQAGQNQDTNNMIGGGLKFLFGG